MLNGANASTLMTPASRANNGVQRDTVVDGDNDGGTDALLTILAISVGAGGNGGLTQAGLLIVFSGGSSRQLFHQQHMRLAGIRTQHFEMHTVNIELVTLARHAAEMVGYQ